MGVKNTKKQFSGLKLEGVEYKLSFTIANAEYLAEKYDSIFTALEKFDELSKDLRLTKDQINLISDFLFVCAGGQLESPEEAKKLLSIPNIGMVLAGIKNAVLSNNLQVEDSPGSDPQKP